jgi:hypothetical protein
MCTALRLRTGAAVTTAPHVSGRGPSAQPPRPGISGWRPHPTPAALAASERKSVPGFCQRTAGPRVQRWMRREPPPRPRLAADRCTRPRGRRETRIGESEGATGNPGSVGAAASSSLCSGVLVPSPAASASDCAAPRVGGDGAPLEAHLRVNWGGVVCRTLHGTQPSEPSYSYFVLPSFEVYSVTTKTIRHGAEEGSIVAGSR